MIFAGRNILRMRFGALLKNYLVTNGLIGMFAAGGYFFVSRIAMDSYFIWIIWGGAVFLAVTLISTAAYAAFYPAAMKVVFTTAAKKLRCGKKT